MYRSFIRPMRRLMHRLMRRCACIRLNGYMPFRQCVEVSNITKLSEWLSRLKALFILSIRQRLVRISKADKLTAQIIKKKLASVFQIGETNTFAPWQGKRKEIRFWKNY
ncbi:MAG: hypothetical protein JST23_02040 [Bacteroidetes bacterium]|nr:hypothetical protein [Bacteroidota bacterium]